MWKMKRISLLAATQIGMIGIDVLTYNIETLK